MSSLTDALETLANAHGASALASAFRKVQRHVKAERQSRRTEDRTFAHVVMAAVDLRATLQADGATGHDLEGGLIAVLKASWPRSAEARAWQTLCPACDDYGLVLRACEGLGCGLAKGQRHGPHTYGVPCHCKEGARYRERAKGPENVMERAAKTSKPTRFGTRS
jgi:hypothetical protein